MKDTGNGRWQLGLISHRIYNAELTDAKAEFDTFTQVLWNNRRFLDLRVLLVGDNGNYTVAQYAKQYIQEAYRTSNVDVATVPMAIGHITQFDYIVDSYYGPKYDLVVVFSYSGKGMEEIYTLCRRKLFPLIIFTGRKKESLYKTYPEAHNFRIISYHSEDDGTSMEGGKLPMASVLAPISLMSNMPTNNRVDYHQRILTESDSIVNKYNLKELSINLRNFPIVHVFYEYDTLPVAIDIENKLTNAGIAAVVLHDKETFCKGRYAILYNQPFGFIINLVHYRQYNKDGMAIEYSSDEDKILSSFLANLSDYRYITMGSTKKNACSWNLEVLYQLPFFVVKLGEEMGIDVSEPIGNTIPSELRELVS